mgnify:CR=1 FL=1
MTGFCTDKRARSASSYPVSLTLLVGMAVWVCGCSQATQQEEVVAYTTADVQVDSTTAGEVGSSQLCVAGSTVYAVWHDDRQSGRHQVFFDAGRAGGQNWGDVDVQLSLDPSGGQSLAENPDIACAGDSVYVVWEDDRDSELGLKNVYFAYSDDGGRQWFPQVDGVFQGGERVTSDPDGEWDALGPRISVDYDPELSPDKLVYISWYDGRRGAYDIYFTRNVNAHSPEEEIRLDTDLPGSAYSAHPIVATDGLGGVFVAWEDSREGSNDVYLNRSMDWGVNWLATDVRLDGAGETPSDAFGVTMSVDREATPTAVHVAWHDDRNGAKDIFVAASLDAGGTWPTEPSRVDNDVEGGANSFYPSVTASGGRVLVAWHDDRDVGYDIFLRGSDDGGQNWASEYRIDTDVAGSAHSLSARMARDEDRVALVWSDFRALASLEGEPHPDIYLRTSMDGGQLWSEEEERVDDDPQSTAISSDPQIAIAGPLLHILWTDYRLGKADLWYRSMPAP